MKRQSKNEKTFWNVKPFNNVSSDPWGDFDKDFWPNQFDCRPKNPQLQHIRPSQVTKERLKKLPIYFVSGPAESHVGIRKYYTLEGDVIYRKGGKAVREKAKHIPKNVKTAITRFYSMIKKRPDVIGEIERKTPGFVIFTVKGGDIEKGYKLSTSLYPKGIEAHVKGGLEKKPGQHEAVVRLTSERGYPYRREDIESSAGTAVHELEHIRQEKVWKGKPKLQKKMAKGKYSKRREEVLAWEASRKAKRKRYTWGKEKPFFEGFRRMTDEED